MSRHCTCNQGRDEPCNCYIDRSPISAAIDAGFAVVLGLMAAACLASWIGVL